MNRTNLMICLNKTMRTLLAKSNLTIRKTTNSRKLRERTNNMIITITIMIKTTKTMKITMKIKTISITKTKITTKMEIMEITKSLTTIMTKIMIKTTTITIKITRITITTGNITMGTISNTRITITITTKITKTTIMIKTITTTMIMGTPSQNQTSWLQSRLQEWTWMTTNSIWLRSSKRHKIIRIIKTIFKTTIYIIKTRTRLKSRKRSTIRSSHPFTKGTTSRRKHLRKTQTHRSVETF